MTVFAKQLKQLRQEKAFSQETGTFYLTSSYFKMGNG